MSTYEFHEFDSTGGVATITLNRPPLNILHNPMMEELNNLLEAEVVGANIAAVVFRANGKAFSAGVDVGDHSADQVGQMIHLFHGIFRKLASIDAVSIACVNGAALGGGCELACFCDVVLASEKAKFGQPEVQVGVFPPVAACVFPHRVGLAKAIELISFGTVIKANEALRIGLADQVYPVDSFDDEVNAYLDQVRKLSCPVVRLAKQATMTPFRSAILAHLDEAEQLYLNELMQLADCHEGIAAFLEKRTPQWKHE